ncbi:MAG: hypothetical protein H7178_01150 [Chitinophagaceae bacterium]|nr:hypothetical protein [Chitinophagaceae bacterium]
MPNNDTTGDGLLDRVESSQFLLGLETIARTDVEERGEVDSPQYFFAG